MKIEATYAKGVLEAELVRLGSGVQDAASAAVLRQTEETKGVMRGQIAQRLSARAANALRSKRYVNAPNSGRGTAGEVAGFIFSAWWRKDRQTGEDIDMFAAYERGDVIFSAKGLLAVPLAAAYRVVGLAKGTRGGKRRPTPVDVEAALDTDLFVLKRPGRNPLLCARGVVQGAPGRGGARPIRAARYRTKRGTLATRKGATGALVPLFVLLKTTRLPKRLDFDGIEERSAGRMAEHLIVELGRRGLQ
jgi:hypothetical protein